MPNMQENIASLKHDIETSRDSGVKTTTISTLPLVVVHDISTLYGNRCVTYFTATHWGPHGVLKITYLPPLPDPWLSWSSAGPCGDATPCEIAKAMCIVWEDASRRLCRGQSLENKQAEPIEAT